MTEQLHPRDEASIANAMLLGELVHSAESNPAKYYAFEGQGRLGSFASSKHIAAWLFLGALGYGIESNGTEIVKLLTLMERVV
jgi:hypothetical protein